MNSLMPAARASSIAYCTSGRSTSVMISFGTDFVAGRKRVPRPATGKIALVTLFFIRSSSTSELEGIPVGVALWHGWPCQGYFILGESRYPNALRRQNIRLRRYILKASGLPGSASSRIPEAARPACQGFLRDTPGA